MERFRPECVILMGLQGAGKTRLYRERFAGTHAHVSLDLYPSARNGRARLIRDMQAALVQGRSLVIDNTHPTVADRAPLIAEARRLGATVTGYFFDVTTRQAVARNAGRTGRGRVPPVAIFATAKRLEPPTLAEGFDALFRVRLADRDTFEIVPWEE